MQIFTNNPASRDAAASAAAPMTRDELNSAIIERWQKPMSAGDIAKELNLTRNNVMGRIWRAKRRGEKLR